MPLGELALVTLSGFTHALWNLWAKKSRDPVVFLWSFQFVAVAVYGPFAWLSLIGRAVPASGWSWLLLTLLLHGVYVLLLARSYRLADLSQIYPLMRGTAPMLVPLLGAVLLGEQLSWLGWLGVLLIVAGILVVGGQLGRRGTPRRVDGRMLRLGLAVGVAIAAYTLVDKVTLQYVPAVALTALSNAGNVIALTLPALRTRDALASWRHEPRLVIAGGVLSPLSYLLFLTAIVHGPVAAIAPLRELGIVFGTLLGVFVLRESGGRTRIVGACLITLGAIALGSAG